VYLSFILKKGETCE